MDNSTQEGNEFVLFLILISVPTGTMFWNLGDFKAKVDLCRLPDSLVPVHTFDSDIDFLCRQK